MKSSKKSKEYINIWIIAVAFVCLALIIFAYATNHSRFGSSQPAQEVQKTPPATRVTIDFGNGKQRAFESDMDDTAYGLGASFEAIATAGKLNVTIRGGKLVEVAGVGNKPPRAWHIYKNGALQTTPITKLEITGGDRYLIKYE